MQAREALECCKESLMDSLGVSSKDTNANRNKDSKDCVHKISYGSEDSYQEITTGYMCYIQAKNLFTFYPSGDLG